MDRRMYERLQEKLSELLTKNTYRGAVSTEAYSRAVLDAKMLVRDEFYRYEDEKGGSEE